MSSRACPCVAPALTSLRPSRLATSTAGAPVALPGTVIPAGGVTSLLADAALIPNVAEAAAAARTAPMPRARRRFVLLIMVIFLPDFGRRGGRKPNELILSRVQHAVRASRWGEALEVVTSTGQADHRRGGFAGVPGDAPAYPLGLGALEQARLVAELAHRQPEHRLRVVGEGPRYARPLRMLRVHTKATLRAFRF